MCFNFSLQNVGGWLSLGKNFCVLAFLGSSFLLNIPGGIFLTRALLSPDPQDCILILAPFFNLGGDCNDLVILLLMVAKSS